MKRILILLIGTLAVFAGLTSSSDSYKFEENYDLYASNESYQIVSGNCTNSSENFVVFRDYIHKTSYPFITRNATSSWSGNRKIFCLKAINLKNQQKGGTVFVKYGGVNYTFVTLEMHSFTGHGIEFNVTVYAR
ncbi:uncharacterized protein LOC132697207 [Cylas formicarius]|uniref:uncharacterized protein LOC132697207 n=1 Tax=Cylas formicarius TaxID=197179 RepID=UPI0029588005|nr:uncharacterized protein LOC132697207 [Cylas formicarius]